MQKPMDNKVCGVNFRPPASDTLAEFIFACKGERKGIEIGNVYCNLFDSAVC